MSVVSKSGLLSAFTDSIDVHICRLRAKVDDPYDPSLIQTVRGVGYVLDERRDR